MYVIPREHDISRISRCLLARACSSFLLFACRLYVQNSIISLGFTWKDTVKALIQAMYVTAIFATSNSSCFCKVLLK